MSKFVNDANGVVVSVDDSKDERFGEGWSPADKPKSKPAASTAKK